MKFWVQSIELAKIDDKFYVANVLIKANFQKFKKKLCYFVSLHEEQK